MPQFDHIGLTLRTGFRSAAIGPARERLGIGRRARRPRGPRRSRACAASAAAIPESIALWLPLMRGTFTKPAAVAEQHPARKISFGTDCQPPSVIARAP